MCASYVGKTKGIVTGTGTKSLSIALSKTRVGQDCISNLALYETNSGWTALVPQILPNTILISIILVHRCIIVDVMNHKELSSGCKDVYKSIIQIHTGNQKIIEYHHSCPTISSKMETQSQRHK